ncbi:MULTISPECIES: amidohydrolase [unclassified Variovorax]|uniref:amidohydrolase n=1 Tax=unclassified Variovorax TaxID=663243 RepID=UPI00257662A7|nr:MULTISPECIES: amidohydrolase [unclassified Variovorax]MDM0090272.1 amidohydrolase [Variovorax sp. J22G40]MDM0148062.1 amidohydrolase [Variovorax sp. J2P1-31]
MTTTLYPARKIITMNPDRPVAGCVAVRDGRVLGVGTQDELAAWGAHRIDTRFAHQVLMPGFVEGHCHLSQGALWRFVYVGPHDRIDPDGRLWPALTTLTAVIARLRNAHERAPHAPVIGWGFDPLSLAGPRCNRHDLDTVAERQAVVLMHASLHVISTNTAGLQAGGFLRAGIDHPGLPLGPDGLPAGELRGPDAMWPVAEAAGLSRQLLAADADGIRVFSRLCVRTGVTTAADLANPLSDEIVEMMRRVTGAPDFPLRVVSMQRMAGQGPVETVANALRLKALSSDRLRLGFVKVVVDGSIQGLTARVRWPGYFNGAPNGLWYVAPEQLCTLLSHALGSGVPVHLHTNGDEATELALDCMQTALAESPAPDHRFTLQHAQMSTRAQFLRMRALGLCVNLFVNHLYYWGDIHRAQTLGPERAERMNACASAIEAGVPFAIHSDAPVTPLAPLFTAWCAVNRLTASGRVLGAAQRIDVAQALHAITLGAAYTLGLDHEIGSIEAGKHADFAVLDDDPLDGPPSALKDIGVWGVVQGGRVFPAAMPVPADSAANRAADIHP